MAEKEKKSIEEKKTIEEKKEEEIKPEEIISLSEAPIEELKQFKEMDEFDIVRIRQLYVEHLFDQPTKNEMGFLTNTQKTDLTDGGATTLHKHDHGDLDGLSDDDHPQYKTDTKNYEAGENLTIRKLSSRGHQATINGETILRDSYVSEITGEGDTNFGSQTYMRVEQDSISHFTKGIIWFDISSLPNADDVDSVKLKFYVSKVINLGGSNYMVIGTKRVTATWVENTITWNNKPGEGGTYGSSANINATGWYEVDITNLYKEWKNGTYTNYGVWLYGSEYSVTHLPAYSDINSKEAASNKPYLYITYWGDKTKVYKATAANWMGTHLVGFNTESKNTGQSILIQSSGSLDGLSLTEGSSYYVSDTPGEISTAPGTVTKEVGVALSSSVLLIQLEKMGAVLGDWVTKNDNTVYQAETDGFVVCYSAEAVDTGNVYIVTDANNPPTTQRTAGRFYAPISGSGGQIGLMCPVKKNNYWKVVGCSGGQVYWIPLSI